MKALFLLLLSYMLITACKKEIVYPMRVTGRILNAADSATPFAHTEFGVYQLRDDRGVFHGPYTHGRAFATDADGYFEAYFDVKGAGRAYIDWHYEDLYYYLPQEDKAIASFNAAGQVALGTLYADTLR